VSVDKKTIVVLKERVSGRRPTLANDGLPTISGRRPTPVNNGLPTISGCRPTPVNNGLPTISGCRPTPVNNGLPSVSDTCPSLDSRPTLAICLVKQLISTDSLPVTFVCRRNRFLA
jgi:hypothetical protein